MKTVKVKALKAKDAKKKIGGATDGITYNQDGSESIDTGTGVEKYFEKNSK